jgi:hypothetical protein
MLTLKSLIGIACLAFLGVVSTASAQERKAITPLQRQLDALILPEVKFNDADLIGALRYFTQKISHHSGQKVRVPFAIDLPEGFATRYELTLDLHRVPAAEALRYLGTQAGVEFNYQGDTIVVQPLGTASAKAATRKPAAERRPNKNFTNKGFVNPLHKPVEPAYSGNNVHRATGGAVQAEKSGYIPRRAMGGYSTTVDPWNTVDVNCRKISVCPHGCGCGLFCTCKKPPPKK